MKPIKETIPLDEARQLIADACTPIERTERVRIVDANGRVAAADVTSTRDVPPFSRAGMDGYAVRAEDTFGASRYEPKSLKVIEKYRRRNRRGNRHRRTDAVGRRCGGDGRGDREVGR
jgi:molybdopterin molybdotransferase